MQGRRRLSVKIEARVEQGSLLFSFSTDEEVLILFCLVVKLSTRFSCVCSFISSKLFPTAY